MGLSAHPKGDSIASPPEFVEGASPKNDVDRNKAQGTEHCRNEPKDFILRNRAPRDGVNQLSMPCIRHDPW